MAKIEPCRIKTMNGSVIGKCEKCRVLHDRPILMYFQHREYTLSLESYHAETRVSHPVTILTPIFAIK